MHFGWWYGVIIYFYCKILAVLCEKSLNDSRKNLLCSLGKTLQSITLLFTLLRQGFDGKPMVKKAIIVTPTSLVSNWEAEIKKWVQDRVQIIALCESSREDIMSGINNFTNPCSTTQVKFTIVILLLLSKLCTYLLNSVTGIDYFIRDIQDACSKIQRSWIMWSPYLWWGSQAKKWSDDHKPGKWTCISLSSVIYFYLSWLDVFWTFGTSLKMSLNASGIGFPCMQAPHFVIWYTNAGEHTSELFCDDMYLWSLSLLFARHFIYICRMTLKSFMPWLISPILEFWGMPHIFGGIIRYASAFAIFNNDRIRDYNGNNLNSLSI